MNEPHKDFEKMLMEFYHKGFADCEAAAKKALEHGIKHAILAEREACAVLIEGGNHVHPKAPDSIWAKTVAKLIRARSLK